MGSKTASILLLGMLAEFGGNPPLGALDADEVSAPAPVGDVGSQLTAKEADAVVAFHNKVRREVHVNPVTWSSRLSKYAQEWADEVARTGKVVHRSREGAGHEEYGENMAWGIGDSFDALAGAKYWYDEMKFYESGSPIPEDFGSFKAGHYSQMVWKETTEIGAGKAVIQQGEKKGWTVIVCNYNPPGNITGEKPY